MYDYSKNNDFYKDKIKKLNKDIESKLFNSVVVYENKDYYLCDKNGKKVSLKNYAGDVECSYEVVKKVKSLGANMHLGYFYDEDHMRNFWYVSIIHNDKKYTSGKDCLTLAEAICESSLNLIENKTQKTNKPNYIIEFPLGNN